ncbi:MAG: PQQ-binding-like beta-propeller repeat protein [Candidatus Sumerlaeaceae bacterium]
MTIKNAILILLCGIPALLTAAEVTTLTLEFSDESTAAALATGRIYEDTNNNGKFDAKADVVIGGVGVSDGDQIIFSGNDGKYTLPLTAESKVVYITRPANYQRTSQFYALLPDDFTSTATTSVAVAQTSGPRTFQHDFILKRTAKPDSSEFRFVQTTDIHINGTEDRERFASGLEEISNLAPAADFVVATGDLLNSGNSLEQYEVYTSTSRLCRIPYFHVIGNHDVNKGDYKTRNYHQFLGPDYYSVDFGEWHLLMLNCVNQSERQDRWLERDLRMLARGKRLLAFQHFPANEKDLEKFQKYGIRAVFSGHWHSNKMTSHENGLVNINHPTFLMGGIDGSPSSFRIVSIHGEQINSEYRINEFGKRLTITYPQGELSGPERLFANIYDSSGGVREARFRVQQIGQAPAAQGELKQVSPISWMAPLDSKRIGTELPSEFMLRVRATNYRGEQWETSQTVTRPVQRGTSAAEVKLGADWPQFMGNAQRTGQCSTALAPPLKVSWATPTHGYIDLASPVLFKGRLAMTVKDRDNMINNGVWLLDAKSGDPVKFIRADSMINHSAAFAGDKEDGPGKLYALSVGGTVYTINPEKGDVEATGKLADGFQQHWFYSGPAIQGRLAILGSSAMLQALDSQFGEHKWTNNFGKDWISSYACPTLAGDIVIMGANWLNKDKKAASIYALDVNNGQVKWVNECKGTHGSIAVAQGRGYAIDTLGALKIIDLQNGQDITTRSLGKGSPLSTPAVDPEVVIAAGAAGEVHCYNTQTLEERWVFRTGNGLWKLSPYDKTSAAVFSSPTIAGQHVYIGCSDGKLYALDKATGDVRWFYDFGVPVLSTPCISGNTLFAAAYDGTVYAFTSNTSSP